MKKVRATITKAAKEAFTIGLLCTIAAIWIPSIVLQHWYLIVGLMNLGEMLGTWASHGWMQHAAA
jgi:hypothetical protein